MWNSRCVWSVHVHVQQEKINPCGENKRIAWPSDGFVDIRPPPTLPCSWWPRWPLAWCGSATLHAFSCLGTNPVQRCYWLHCTLLTFFPLFTFLCFSCVCVCAWLRWCSTSRGLLRSQTPNENKRKHSGESAVIRWKERVARGWKNTDVKKWGDGRRRHEIPWWVLLSSRRITAAATITSAALPDNTPVPLKMRYPALERNQMITFME